MILAALLLVAVPLVDQGPAPRMRLILAEETLDVPHGEWRSLEVALKQQVAMVECHYRVNAGPPVRIALLNQRQLEELRAGRLAAPFSGIQQQRGGFLRQAVPEVGDYFVILDNSDGQRLSQVDLRVSLLFPGGGRVRSLDPKRRTWVIALSLVFFAFVAGYAGTRLSRAGVFHEWR